MFQVVSGWPLSFEEASEEVRIVDTTGKVVIDERSRKWCTLPYPDHPKGCPNYGKKDVCPPMAPLVSDFIDLSKTHWLAVYRFDIALHEERMQERKARSRRQARNPLYWQGWVRARLRDACDGFCRREAETLVYTLIPEAMGVNVFRTVIPLGLKIKTRPEKYIYKVALIGYCAKQKCLQDFL